MNFLNPFFLLGIAAISVPILVHLVRRTKAPRMTFPSLMFIRNIPQKTIRRRQLINLLLLLIRSAALLLLIFAFVRPYFSSDAQNTSSSKADLVLLDTSFSMRYEDSFNKAKQQAASIINNINSNSSVSLITFDRGFDIQSRFTNDMNQLKAILNSTQANNSGTDYIQALRAAESLFKDVRASNKNIYLISDFQATGKNNWDTKYKVSKDIKLHVIDVGNANAANIAIADVSAQPLSYQSKYSDKIIARIANYSDNDLNNIVAEFLLNDRVIEKRDINILARSETPIEFTGFTINDGANRAIIRVRGDNFNADNQFNFVLRRTNQMKALIVDSNGGNDSFYLRNALTTGDNLPFNLDVKSGGSVNPAELNQYQLIIVNDAGNIKPAVASQLIKYVESGKGLIIATGPHTDVSDFNKLFATISPATLDETIQLRGNYSVMSEIKTDHPIFEIFKQSGRAASAKFFAYYKTTPKENSSVAARYDNGDPAIVESPATSTGGGKVILFTSTFDSSWNDLALTSLFLPVVRQMTRYMSEPTVTLWNKAGETFSASLSKDGIPPPVDSPTGDRITNLQTTSARELIINGRDAGFYRLRYPDKPDFQAVNVDPDESNFARLDIQQFKTELGGGGENKPTTTAQSNQLSGEEIESSQNVWLMLLIVAGLLFLTEIVFTRYLTRRHRGTKIQPLKR